MSGGYRDLVITELADSEAELIARVADLEAERDSYRELLALTLAQLHDVMEREKRLTGRIRELTEMARSLRRAA